jgi:hypothetical protein
MRKLKNSPDITIYGLKNGKTRVWFREETKNSKTAYVVGQSFEYVCEFISQHHQGKTIKKVNRNVV